MRSNVLRQRFEHSCRRTKYRVCIRRAREETAALHQYRNGSSVPAVVCLFSDRTVSSPLSKHSNTCPHRRSLTPYNFHRSRGACRSASACSKSDGLSYRTCLGSEDTIGGSRWRYGEAIHPISSAVRRHGLRPCKGLIAHVCMHELEVVVIVVLKENAFACSVDRKQRSRNNTVCRYTRYERRRCRYVCTASSATARKGKDGYGLIETFVMVSTAPASDPTMDNNLRPTDRPTD